MKAAAKQGKLLRLSLLGSAMIGLASLVACGGGGGGGTVVVPPPPPPPTNTGITVYPGTATVPLGGKAVFTAFAPSSPSATNFTWTVTGGSANGSITTDNTGKGDYVAPTTQPAGAVTVTVTSSNLGGSATVTITAVAAGGIVVSPGSIAVPAGTTFQFSATANGGAATVTNWQVNGTNGGDTQHGSIDGNGNYTAPATPPPGGSTTITAVTASGSATANATVVFSNDSLSGPYAFSYTGIDTTGYLAVAGSFTAQSGTLTGGEDGTDLGGTLSASISGEYAIGPDGRGTVTIVGGPNQGETWQIALAGNPAASPGLPAQHVVLVRFDTAGTGSGSLDQQNSLEAATPFPVGSYAFGLSGIDGAGAEFVAAGKFSSSGNGGTITNASVWDVNFAGTPVTDDTTLTATFQPSAGFAGSVGHGTLTLFSTNATLNTLTGVVSPAPSTFQFFFYVVDNTHVKVVENDGHAFLSGDIFSGPTTPDGSFNEAAILKTGNYAFTVGGASTMGPYVAGGVFAYSAGSETTTGVMDINNGGVQITLDKTLTASFSVDTNLGRISFTFSPTGGSSYAFDGFPTSSGSVELVETDNLAVSGGLALPQVATSEPSGSFATNVSGLAIKTQEGEQDGAGQIAVLNGALTGTLDLNNADVTGGVDPGLELLTGTAIVAPDTNGRGTATLDTSAATFQLVYYVVNPQTVLLMETDATHVVLGTMAAQY